MLVRLTAKQVSDYWPYIKHTLKESVPSDVLFGQGQLTSILESLLCGISDCWFIFEGDSETVSGCVVTTFTHDGVTRDKLLRIYSLYLSNGVTPSVWREGMETLAEYARGNECVGIDAITPFPDVVRIAKKFGADARYTYLSWRL